MNNEVKKFVEFYNVADNAEKYEVISTENILNCELSDIKCLDDMECVRNTFGNWLFFEKIEELRNGKQSLGYHIISILQIDSKGNEIQMNEDVIGDFRVENYIIWE